MTHRAAVFGAGPAGFYTTDQLLSEGWEVDLYDTLPTPFGLVRSGVAPDHPKLKSVTRIYEKTAAKPGFRFFGGVALGEDVTREELLERYHAVVYAVGTADDNRLGIPGEDRPGSHSATEFVAWYNGHPDYAGHQFDLSGGRAVVIGNGNVAIDVARMLVLDPDELAPTDTADHAITHFGRSTVDEVILLGRRGPAQAAFTNPEVRELGELAPRRRGLRPPAGRGGHRARDADPERNVELFRDYAAREPQGKSHRIELRFLRSPLEILGEGEDGPVTGVRVSVNRLEDGRAVPTGEEEVIACALVLRSIGYRGRPLDGIPFDERRGLIANEGGRVGARRVLRRLDQARPLRRDRHQQEGRRRHRRAHPRGRAGRHAGTPAEPDPDAIAAWLAERGPTPSRGRAGRRSTRPRRRRRGPGPPAREARDAGRAARGGPPRAGSSLAQRRPQPVDRRRHVRRVDVVRGVGLVVLDGQAAGLEQLAGAARERDVHDRVVAAVGDERARARAVGERGLPAVDGRDEAGEGEDAGGRRAVRAEPQRVAHHRAHREAAEDGPLRGRARALPQLVVQLRERAVGGVERVVVGVADARHDVPVVPRPARELQRRARRTTCNRRSGSSTSARPSRSCSSAPRPWWRTTRPAGSPSAGRSRWISALIRPRGRARVDDGRQRALELLAQVLVLGRQPQRLAEVLRVLVDREAGGEGRDLEQHPARLAEVDRRK